MKASATQLRVLLLIVNILLGLGVPAYAAYRYFGVKETGRPQGVPLVKPELLRYDPGRDTSKAEVDQLQGVATRLTPKPPPPPPTGPTGPEKQDPTPTPPTGPDELPTGILTDLGYVYASFLLRRDNPLKSLVILRKKDSLPGGPGGPAAGSSRVNPRIRAAAPRTAAGRTGSKVVKAAQPDDQISFTVEKRYFKNEELGIEIFIHSADEKQLIYWTPKEWNEGGQPKQLFSLKYEPGSEYLSSREEPSLIQKIRPRPKTADEEAAAPQEAKQGGGFVPRASAYFEKDHEEEYNAIFSGKLNPNEPVDEPSKGGILKTRAEVEEANTTPADQHGQIPRPGSITPATKDGSTKPPGATTRPGAPRQMTPKEAKELNSTLKQIPKEAQKEIIDALRKGSAGGTKR